MIPFVSFIPTEYELSDELHAVFERVLTSSWYIDGEEDKRFEEMFDKYCNSRYCVGVEMD